jgi:hypothetical protein
MGNQWVEVDLFWHGVTPWKGLRALKLHFAHRKRGKWIQ